MITPAANVRRPAHTQSKLDCRRPRQRDCVHHPGQQRGAIRVGGRLGNQSARRKRTAVERWQPYQGGLDAQIRPCNSAVLQRGDQASAARIVRRPRGPVTAQLAAGGQSGHGQFRPRFGPQQQTLAFEKAMQDSRFGKRPRIDSRDTRCSCRWTDRRHAARRLGFCGIGNR